MLVLYTAKLSRARNRGQKPQQLDDRFSRLATGGKLSSAKQTAIPVVMGAEMVFEVTRLIAR